MDSIVNAALDEICACGASGIALSDLWPTLTAALSSAGLRSSDAVKKIVWSRLLSLPCLRFEANGSIITPQDPLIRFFDESKKIGLRIVAKEQLRDGFVGLDDLNAANAEISKEQRRLLERLGAARSNGITQCELAKEFDIKGNHMFYRVKNLECQQLIVRQSTTIRETESGTDGGNGLKNAQIKNTHLVHLYRYAKNVNLNSQQRIEITRPAFPSMEESISSADTSYFTGDVTSGDSVKEDVLIKDYLRPMKDVCDKLEEASEKFLIVSEIKHALDCSNTDRHRKWRSILERLKCAGLVEEIQVKGKEKNVHCLRLLKKFDPKDFQPKPILSENLVKQGKRGKTTYQLLELPMEHHIYDMVDAEGPKGITVSEVCKRLGLSNKKMYSRIIGMCSRFGMHMESEIPNRTFLFRLWTRKNYYQYTANIFPDKYKVVPDKHEPSPQSSNLVLCERLSPNVQLSDSCSQDVVRHSQTGHGAHKGLEPPLICDGPASDVQVTMHDIEPDNLIHEFSRVDDDGKPDNDMKLFESSIGPSERPSPVPFASSKQAQRHRCVASTIVGAKREQTILKILEDEKFILHGELYRWLKDLEKDTPTTMDRKTLDRTLNKLQDEGLCKITQVAVPVATKFNRFRGQCVLLHPSVDNISSDLWDQIYGRQRSFDTESQRRARARLKNNPLLTIITNVKRSSNRVDDKPVILEAMRANGYVYSRMVRAKLLHKFLWGYLSKLPELQSIFHLGKHNHDLNNHHSSCHFAFNEAIKTMPLELFLQIVGSAEEIDEMVEKCRIGLRLCDLPVQEYKVLMGTQATGRLPCIIDILLRLKLILLVREVLADGVDALLRAGPTHAMELQPYIEEPLPRVLPSSNINSLGLRPVRHDFVLSSLEAVDAYWETLEYCYAAADPASSSHAFPGSVVREVFNSRSWASDQVMTAEQRMELLKRVTNDELPKKISLKECVKIAKELHLTVEQVVRVSSDKREPRLRRYSSTLNSKQHENDMDENKCGSVARKRMRFSKDESVKHPQVDTETEESFDLTKASSNTDRDCMDINSSTLIAPRIHDSPVEACRDDGHGRVVVSSKPHEEDDHRFAFISQSAFCRLKPMRQTRFSWTDKSDRQLVMQYAKHRATLGEKFSRVDWTSLSDLPARPNACGKRMAALNANKNIRRAVMRLCNLLGERHVRYLDTAGRKMDERALNHDDSEESAQGGTSDETGVPNQSATDEDNFESNYQQSKWDDFEEPEVQMALDEVLKCKRMAKIEHAKRIGSTRGKGWPNIAPPEGPNLDGQEVVTLKEQNFISSSPGDINDGHCQVRNKNANFVSTTGRSRSSSHHSRGKFLKLLNSRGTRVRRQVSESLAVANAMELLKLVFLSNSTAPAVQTSIAAILQLYSGSELFAAFNYLKEKEFMVVGHGSQPFVLSQKFWHNASSSPFPVDTGKRAANFSNWLHKQCKDQEDRVDLITDLQCGEIFHLFALVSLGEAIISPCLPKDGIGEADEPPNSKSFLPMDGIDGFDVQKSLKRRSDKVLPLNEEKAKRHKSQGKMDGDFCSRREKGFPRIKVFLNRATIMRADAIQLSMEEENHTCLFFSDGIPTQNSYSSTDKFCYASLSRKLDSPHNLGSSILLEVPLNASPWDTMTEYAAVLSTMVHGSNKAITFCANQFESVYSAVRQTGEQGLDVKEVSKVLGLEGVQLAEIVADTLEVFQFTIKVNAYDCVRIVDSSYRSKYFISMLADRDMVGASSMKSQGMNPETYREKNDNFIDSQNATTTNLCDGHKVSVLDFPPKPGLPIVEKINVENEKLEECNRMEADLVKRNETGSSSCPNTGVHLEYRSILPWINGDGSTNTIVHKGFTRRVLGIVMQNPGILEEDIVHRMDVLNPQSCRQLLGTLVLDNHLTARMMYQSTPAAAPSILQNLFHSKISKPKSEFRKHYFANPMSTSLL